MDLTGHAKTKQMTPEELEQWLHGEIICPCYTPGKPPEGKRLNNDYVFPARQKPRKDRPVERKLYEAGLNDYEIARAIGVRSSAIWLWRRNEGLPPNAGVGAPKKKKEEKDNGED